MAAEVSGPHGTGAPLHVALYRPEIPPNTGNLMRLAANTGVRLHLVGPLGFSLDEPRLRRAGLDYRDYADVDLHPDLDDLLAEVGPTRVLAFTRDGDTRYDEVEVRPGDLLLFGPESTGLDEDVLRRPEVAARVRIPMRPGSRSLNLANAVAVVVYDAWRRLGFPGAAPA